MAGTGRRCICLTVLSKRLPHPHPTGKEQFERKLSEFTAKRKLYKHTYLLVKLHPRLCRDMGGTCNF